MSSDFPEDDRTVIKPVSRGAPPSDAVPPSDAAAPAPVPVPPPAAPTPAPAAPRAPVEDHGNALPTGTYLGEFEITGMLGEGGFGIVYLAWDHSLERRVALKEYMPSALAARTGGTQVSVKSERHRETFEAGRKSFVNEARLLAQFDHASLVKVYRFWEANGTAYMVMPFYEGITLKDQLKQMGGPPDEAWLMNLLAPLTEALEVIHHEQCFHRDIAPDNIILLKGTGRPLLLDFGAARRVIGDMTQALTVILKPGYAPVEQYAEVPGMKQGGWTDLYALAASIYFAIIGKTPPPSVGRLMNDNYVPLTQAAAGRYSERFLAAMDRALIVKPEERTQSIEAFRADLGLGAHVAAPVQTVLHAAPAAAAPTASKPAAAAAASAAAQPAGGAQAPSKSRAPMWIGAGVLGLVVLGGGLYALLGGSPPPNATQATSAAPAPAAPAIPAPTPAPTTAATPAPIVAPTAAPNIPFDPVKEFDRIVAEQTPGFTVEAAPARPQFRIGKDRLAFNVKSGRDGYVYVLLVSTEGAFMKLYPNTMAPDNRIRAGQTLNLPQASWPMDTAGPPGTDHFLVIVSPRPREFDTVGMKVDGGFGEFPLGQEADAIVRAHRGAGSAFVGVPSCPSGVDCATDYGAAVFTSEEIH